MRRIVPLIFGGGLLLLQAGAHGANPITFDPDGPGPETPIQVTTFDWLPDNALAKGSAPLPLGGSKAFVLYSQGKLGNFLNASGAAIAGTGLNTSYEITYQAVLGEIGSTYSPAPNILLSNFSLDPGTPVNYFRIYWDPTPDANPQTGEGYGDGQLILEGYAIGNNTNYTILLDPVTGAIPIEDLDQHTPGNNQPGYGSVVGTGGGQMEARVTNVDGDFFQVDLARTIMTLAFNTSHVSPFHTIEPTGPATSVAGVVGQQPNFGGAGVGGYNWVNGLGGPCEDGSSDCDVLLEADPNMSFDTAPRPVTNIPTLNTAALGLLGLLLAGMAAWRRTG